MVKQQYSRELLISLFRPKTLEQLPNAKYIISLNKIPGSLLKNSVQFPLNFYTDQLNVKEFNQEMMIFSSNSITTPLKTVNVKSQDQFRFDEQIYTPKPQSNGQFFSQSDSPLTVKATRNKPIFCHCRTMRIGSLHEKVWYYIDDSNNVQGPFSSIEMDAWYSKGSFTFRTEIACRTKKADCFLKLKYLKYCKYLRGEGLIYSQIIGRRKSAPKRMSEVEQNQYGPTTTGKTKFGFSEQDQFFPQNLIQENEDVNESHSLFSKVLNIPSGKLGKNKLLKN